MASFGSRLPKFVGLRSATSVAKNSVSVIRVPSSLSSPCLDLYYPVNQSNPDSAPVASASPPLPWLPSYQHAAKWGEFIKVPEFLIGGVGSLVFGSHTIDLVPNLPLKDLSHPFPLIVFSHGLASWGSHYSTLLTHLAQLGFVVAAVDHTDGSSTCSRTANGYDLLYESLAGRDERPFRAAQLQVRIKDCGSAFNFLKVLNGGLADDKEASSSTPRAEDANSLRALRSFAGKLNVAQGFTIVGHSFGGGTAVGVASTNPECLAAVGLDPWMFPPLDAGVLKPSEERAVPYCFITNDKGGISGGRHWRKNCAYIKDLVAGHKDPTKVTAIRFANQDHIDISDAKLILPGNKPADFCFLSNMRIIERFFRELVGIEMSGSATPHADEAEKSEEERRSLTREPW